MYNYVVLSEDGKVIIMVAVTSQYTPRFLLNKQMMSSAIILDVYDVSLQLVAIKRDM